MLVAQGTRQAREEPDSKLYVRLRKDSESLFEQGHELLVTSGPSPDQSPPVARSRAGEVAWTAGAARDGGCVEERLLRTAAFPARMCASPSDRRSSPRRLRRSAERLGAHGAPARKAAPPPRRRAGQAPGLPARLAYSIARSGFAAGTASEKWCASSARCGSDVAGVEGLEHLRDTPMEPGPVGGGISSYNESRVSAWPKRSRPNEPGSSSTTRAVIASSSTLSSLSMPV